MRNLLTDSFELSKREQAPGNAGIELGLQGDEISSAAQPGFEGFFEKVMEVENLLHTLTKLLKNLQSSNEESKVVTRAAEMKEVKKRMEQDVSEVTKVARLAKSKVEQLNKENAANREKVGFGKGSGVDRSRTTTTFALTKRLRERILEFQTLREEIQKEYRDVVERRVFTVTGEHADEEVLDTLQEIQERHDTMKEIEKKLLDLQQIFLDLAVLVQAQGEMLNDIESQVRYDRCLCCKILLAPYFVRLRFLTCDLPIAQVTGANEHIQSGTNQLRKARWLQKNTRKWTCIGIIILLVIALIIILSLKPWNW
ncbi:hypothetical protein PR202_ga12264 [Eleusine coracana subsp. coracana]|uniref:t-SNARE coiled-coil homology domain-containing protein n=1 Tax=Eleusine coracana subsp. coracana TaxID=191504 RepID=A0AAV5CBJ0_ELECO|nr:hypothetical protein PR202_ga12264 [Eleusine coracana subsp. coracana]